MKKAVFLLFLLLAAVGTSRAQATKVGYIDIDFVLGQMNEQKQIQQQLALLEQQLNEQLQAKQQELKQKVEKYNVEAKSLIDAIRKDREREIQALQKSIESYRNDAELTLLQERNKLLSPLYEKIRLAIAKVAEAENYDKIFRSSALVYTRSTDDDISRKVLKELGVELPAATPTEE